MLAHRPHAVDSIRILPEEVQPPHAASSESRIADGSLSHLDVPDQPFRVEQLRLPRTRIIIKRTLDILIACGGLLVLAPMMGLIALLIVLDSPGPPLIRQTRIGAGGRPFKMLKFRTMIRERRVRHGPPPPGIPERRRVHKSRNDPRITRVGRFLRRTCLDEVPQLWNVLRGDMSLVGPRPELPMIVEHYQAWQHQRHQVLPGMTGWWQVNRDERLMHDATEFDIYYIEHQSLWLDLMIIAKTFGIVLRGISNF
jgi:lipopolysaccharide/colanic/teichoic acid biosynthesis glycosyltransferase